ncbi:MAG: hypothetical protein ACPHK3_07350 [Candidatus Poseidoniaceae archaeon]
MGMAQCSACSSPLVRVSMNNRHDYYNPGYGGGPSYDPILLSAPPALVKAREELRQQLIEQLCDGNEGKYNDYTYVSEHVLHGTEIEDIFWSISRDVELSAEMCVSCGNVEKLTSSVTEILADIRHCSEWVAAKSSQNQAEQAAQKEKRDHEERQRIQSEIDALQRELDSI